MIDIHKNGIATTFTVRRIGANGIGVEKIFPFYSENIAEIKENSIEAVKTLYNWKRHTAEIVKFSQEISKA